MVTFTKITKVETEKQTGKVLWIRVDAANDRAIRKIHATITGGNQKGKLNEIANKLIAEGLRNMKIEG